MSKASDLYDKLPQSVLLAHEAERRRLQSLPMNSKPCPVCGGLGWVELGEYKDPALDAVECDACEDGLVYLVPKD